jgi:hypothetical protein
MPILPLLKTQAFNSDAAEALASAFDALWNVMAIITREVLAVRIIAMRRTGEKDRQRLVNDALARVANSTGRRFCIRAGRTEVVEEKSKAWLRSRKGARGGS